MDVRLLFWLSNLICLAEITFVLLLDRAFRCTLYTETNHKKKEFTDKPIQTSNIEGCLNLCVCIVRQILE